MNIKHKLLGKKIPSYIGILTLLLFVPIISWLVENNTIIPVKANPDHTPRDVQVSNITDSSFTVSYVTTDATSGVISYGESQSVGEINLDTRDKGIGKPLDHKAHYFTIEKLQPNTTHYFTILSGNMAYKNADTPYIVTTGPSISASPQKNQKIAGTVLLPDGTYPSETIVYIVSNTSQLLSKLVEADGSFSIDATNIRSNTLTEYFAIPDTEDMQIRLTNSDMQTFINVLGKNLASIPTVTLSKNYDFTYIPTPSDSVSTPMEITDTSNLFPEYSTNKTLSKNPEILIPMKDQAFDDLQPEFSGVALPSKNIDISFDTSTIKATVKTNASGNWLYRPKNPLEPGNHTMIISVKDDSGMILTTSQTFAIHAIGSQFFAPSPSASPTQTPTLTPTINTTPSVSPTIAPTSALSPTITPNLSPTAIPTVTPTVIPNPTQILPTTPPVTPIPSITSPGSGTVIITVSLAVFATIAGIVLFFFVNI